MRTNHVCTCIVLITACMLSIPVKGQELVRNRTIHYSQMMIKLDGTVVSTQDNGASWTRTPASYNQTKESAMPAQEVEGQVVIVADVLGNIVFQGSDVEWRYMQYNSSLYGAMLIVTKHSSGVSTTERLIRTR